MKYRNIFLDDPSESLSTSKETSWHRFSIDPFQYLTQSQVCQTLFLLGLNSRIQIAHFPAKSVHGWSKKSLLWLEYMQHQLGFHIEHKGNKTHEGRLKQYYPVDGYGGNPRTGRSIVLQFYGCYWHGCPRCYPNRTKIHPHKQKTTEEIYRETLEIEYKLKSMDKQDF